jgi:hypothetical protein
MTNQILILFHLMEQQAFLQLWIAQQHLHDSIRTRNFLQTSDLQHPENFPWHQLHEWV